MDVEKQRAASQGLLRCNLHPGYSEKQYNPRGLNYPKSEFLEPGRLGTHPVTSKPNRAEDEKSDQGPAGNTQSQEGPLDFGAVPGL